MNQISRFLSKNPSIAKSIVFEMIYKTIIYRNNVKM